VIVPDVNLLLFAHLTAFAEHERAREWWKELLDGDEGVGLGSIAIFGFVRISTNRRMVRQPLAVETAAAVVESWLARPQVELIHPGSSHVEMTLRLLREVGTAGDLATDAQLAALAIENNAELHSADTDFGRFSGLRWVNPLAKR
jgi:toxin-antitoxin system PIN domain toxin